MIFNSGVVKNILLPLFKIIFLTFASFFRRIRSPLFFLSLFVAVIYGIIFWFRSFQVEKDVSHFIFDEKTGTIEGIIDGYLPSEKFVFPDEINGVTVKAIQGKIIIKKSAIGKKRKSISIFGTNASFIKTVVLPRYLEKIDFAAFRYCSNLSKIKIPSTVHYIGRSAFGSCSSLENITLPSELCFIGDHAFRSCKSLKVVKIRGFSHHLFDDTNLEPYRFGNSLGRLAFYECKNLTFVELPPQFTAIHTAAFYYCTKLQYIFLPDRLKFIYRSAFSHCTDLRILNGTKHLTYISDYAFAYCDNLQVVNFPSNLEYIGGRAFFHCQSLTSIKLPPKVTALKNLVFAVCTSLKKVTLPKNLTYFNCGAFIDAGSQLAIHFSQPHPEKIDFLNNISDKNRYKGIEKIVVPSHCLFQYQKSICTHLQKKVVGTKK